MRSIKSSHLLRLLFCILATLVLTGCVKMQIGIEVNPDGSGNINLAMGLTQQARTLIASQSGTDPMQDITKSFSKSADEARNISVKRWKEGEYEWAQANVSFKDPADLNDRMSRINFFESFTFKREPGLFKDRFVLDARIKPLSTSLDTGSTSSNTDPSAFIDIQMTARLPGNIVETNGVADGNDKGKLLWTPDNKQTITVRAVSESWNWLNIGVIGGVVGLIVLSVFVISGVIAYSTARKRAVRRRAIAPPHLAERLPSPGGMMVPAPLGEYNTPPATVQVIDVISPIPRVPKVSTPPMPDLLVTIGARTLLEEINHYVLKDIGTLEETSGELRLSWSVIPGAPQTREILVKVASDQRVNLNGAVIPATYDAVKQELANCLRKMSRPRA